MAPQQQYAQQLSPVQPAGPGEAISEALHKKALQSINKLPPFSPILTRLVASLADEDVSFAKLADLIEKDAVAASGVLQLVNSPLYCRRGTISSVRHALSILGFAKLRNAVLGMSIARIWSKVRTPPNWSMARFNLHSSATAVLADLLAQRLHPDYAEGAFVAGLLHDVGRLLIAVGLPDEYARISAFQQRGMTLLEAETRILGFMHCSLSESALHFWNIPAPVRVAVRDHHAEFPDESAAPPAAVVANCRLKPTLSMIVAASDQYVHCAGIGIAADPVQAIQHPLLIERTGITAQDLESVLTDFNAEHENMAQFFH